MFYSHELYFLQQMLTKCHLQSRIIDPAQPLDEGLDMGLCRLFSRNDYPETFSDFFPTVSENTVYRLADVFMCRYVFLRLPTSESENILLIGPYMNVDISQQQILEQCERMSIPPKMFEQLKAFYSSLPVIREEGFLFAMVNSFAEYLWGGADNFESVEVNREDTAAFVSRNIDDTRSPNSVMLNIAALERRYEYENELMSAVSQGNIHRAERIISGFSSLAFENRVPDRLRNLKNYCIVLNTLLRKAAENGGVHPVQLDSVSSDLAKKLENIHSLSAIPDFMTDTVKTYCNLVKRHSIKNYSPIVQKAIIRIQNDLTSDLSLNTMAKMCNVSPSYFSSLFKKETGKTLTKYTNDKRVALAKRLLKTTNLQVQTIAQHCGILDLHYFCRIFKASVGKTPTEYKNNLSFD